MKELPKSTAQRIYAQDYIERPNFHRVIALSPAVGEKLVDAGKAEGRRGRNGTLKKQVESWLLG